VNAIRENERRTRAGGEGEGGAAARGELARRRRGRRGRGEFIFREGERRPVRLNLSFD
jgi:hypothetical protein